MSRSTSLVVAIVAGLAGTPTGADQPASTQSDKTVEATTSSNRVTGVVVDDSGQPVVNAAVALIAESYTRQWQILGEDTRTGPDGRFAIEGIASGVYWVTAAVPTVTKASAPEGSTVTVQNNGDMLRTESRNGTTTAYRFFYSDQREITVANGPVLDVRVVVKRPN